MKNTPKDNISNNQKSIIGADVQVGKNLNIGNTHNQNNYYYSNESRWLYPLFSLIILSIAVIFFVFIFKIEEETPIKNETHITKSKDDTFELDKPKVIPATAEKTLSTPTKKAVSNKKKVPKTDIPQRPTSAYFDLNIADDKLKNVAFSFFAKRLAVYGINLSKSAINNTLNGKLTGNIFLEKEIIDLGAPGFRVSFSMNATLLNSNDRPQGKPYVTNSESFFLSSETEISRTFKHWLESLYNDEFIQLTPI